MNRKIWILGLVLIFTLACFGGKAQAASADTDEKRRAVQLTDEQAFDSGKNSLSDVKKVRTNEGLNDQSDDNEALFAGYVEQLFYPGKAGDPSSAEIQAASHTDQLNEQMVSLYVRMRLNISQVASGLLPDTDFIFTLSALGFGSDMLNIPWTAADLGVPSILDQNGNVTDQAYNALMSKLEIDTVLLINILLADFPYELYWFDKTESGGYAFGAGPVYIGSVNGETCLYFTEDSLYEIALCVAAAYSESGETGTFTADTDKTAAAAQAAKNAADVIARADHESIYVRLRTYMEGICELVSYNEEAANDDNYVYGDPWQLIYVFDNDPTTNVVCEGYSKAFKYLCDIGIQEYSFPCITVSGWMAGGTGAGPHMWNVVTMPDGKNYLVDVTNCDRGSIGEPDQLFLAGYDEKEQSNGDNIYFFLCASGYVAYLYDEDTLSVYSADELILTNSDYVQGGSICDREGHDFEDPVWTWWGYDVPDSSVYAGAVFTCKNDRNHRVTLVAEASGSESGNILTYMASVNLEGKEYSDTLKIFQRPVSVNARSVTFKEKLELNLKLVFPEELLADPNAYVTLEFNGTTRKIRVADAPVDGGRRVFTQAVNSNQMKLWVSLRVYTGNNILVRIIDNGNDITDTGYVYSVQTYLTEVQDANVSAEMKALAIAAENYGLMS